MAQRDQLLSPYHCNPWFSSLLVAALPRWVIRGSARADPPRPKYLFQAGEALAKPPRTRRLVLRSEATSHSSKRVPPVPQSVSATSGGPRFARLQSVG